MGRKIAEVDGFRQGGPHRSQLFRFQWCFLFRSGVLFKVVQFSGQDFGSRVPFVHPPVEIEELLFCKGLVFVPPVFFVQGGHGWKGRVKRLHEPKGLVRRGVKVLG